MVDFSKHLKKPAAAPATQHRVIPVEWHRVAVEPGDACDCEDHPCPHADEQLRRLAQPANTDDRQADTIPEAKCWLPRGHKGECDPETVPRCGAETRIEVLEAALRLSQRALLSGEQMDGLGERYALDGALVIEACTAIRAALAAPSGETKKV